VIVVVAIGLLDVPEFRRIAQVDRSELGLAILAAVIVVAVGMLAGIFSVVLLSLLLVAQQVAQPRTSVLVNVPGTGSYRSVESGQGGEPAEGVVVYRFEAPLIFANATLFSDQITQLVAASPPSVRWVIVNCEAVTSIDSTAVNVLSDVLDYLRGKGVVLALARVKAPLRDVLERVGLADRIGAEHFFLEVDDAVTAAASTEPGMAAESITAGGNDPAGGGAPSGGDQP
jgi:SulP family sulfate permease